MDQAQQATAGQEFAGTVTAVTGGGSGIGLATAELVEALGGQVAVLDVAPPAGFKSVAKIKTDITDDDSATAAVDAVIAEFGQLDVLVNNAGIGSQGTVEENDLAQWHHVFDVNVMGLVRVTRAALPHLRRSPHPAIVNTCSIVATDGLPHRALYSASKGAVLALTRSMAADHVAEGIRVNCVNPGTVETPWITRLLSEAGDPAAERAALQDRQPTGRLVDVDEVAHAIVYLAGPQCRSTTGTALAVDGGMAGLRI